MSDYHNKFAGQDYWTSVNCSIIIDPLNYFPCFFIFFQHLHKSFQLM